MTLEIRPARRIEGLGLRLRDAGMGDAPLLLSLRTDPVLSRHLSPVDGTLAQQEAFLHAYQAGTGQAFFIIETLDGVPWGTVRLYDRRDDSFCWGSWIVRPGAPARTGTRSALLSLRHGFETLGFPACHLDARQGNERAWRLYEAWGAHLLRENSSDRFYTLTRDVWDAMVRRYAERFPLDAIRTLPSSYGEDRS